jgi:hypothetical protein
MKAKLSRKASGSIGRTHKPRTVITTSGLAARTATTAAQRRHVFGMNVPYSVRSMNHCSDTLQV